MTMAYCRAKKLPRRAEQALDANGDGQVTPDELDSAKKDNAKKAAPAAR